jgi:hypothetical protein
MLKSVYLSLAVRHVWWPYQWARRLGGHITVALVAQNIKQVSIDGYIRNKIATR